MFLRIKTYFSICVSFLLISLPHTRIEVLLRNLKIKGISSDKIQIITNNIFHEYTKYWDGTIDGKTMLYY